jgi:hypothetical protein
VSIAKETKVIAALKQHYERYHAEDLAALKELYEYHAENCVRAAELTVDPRRREEYLKLAREWTEAATTLQALTDGMMARRSNQAKPADDAPSLTSRPRNPRKVAQTLDPLRSQDTYEDLEKLRKARARQ